MELTACVKQIVVEDAKRWSSEVFAAAPEVDMMGQHYLDSVPPGTTEDEQLTSQFPRPPCHFAFKI